jgi:hypothetical protein
MLNSLHGSFDGRLELEAHWRPPSLAGQFKLETHSAQVAEPHQRLESILLIVGMILVLPSVLALGLGALKDSLGLAYPYDAAFASSRFVLLATGALFLGTPLALLLNMLAITRWHLMRQPSGLSTALTLKPTLGHLVVLGMAFLVAAAFFGHFVADGVACFYGVKSAC